VNEGWGRGSKSKIGKGEELLGEGLHEKNPRGLQIKKRYGTERKDTLRKWESQRGDG